MCVYLVCLGSLSQGWAQRETDNWLFGQRAGLNFSRTDAIPLDGSAMDQLEGTACLSDSVTGQLLFYSNGVKVWDRNNQIMPNGDGLSGSLSSTQSALLIPSPAKDQTYYLFTIRAYNALGEDGSGGLRYSVIDMSLNEGLGDVIADSKNKLVEHATTEKLTAIPHANHRDYWILTHGWNSNEFLVYLLSPGGLSTGRRVAIGPVHLAGPEGRSQAIGYLKASPNGRHLAAAVYYDQARPFELYDFNDRTGAITNYRSLGDYAWQYGVSFSPDNTKQYLSEVPEFNQSLTGGFFQFDLSTSSNRVTKLPIEDTTRVDVFTYYINGALQLGKDGRLYASTADKGRLAQVKYPNRKGAACEPQYSYFDFKGGMPQFGLPNFMQSYFNDTSSIDPGQSEGDSCNNRPAIYPNPLIGNQLIVHIDSTTCKPSNLKIYDVSGRLFYDYPETISQPLTINVSSWGVGVYIITYYLGSQRVTEKIIKL